MVEAEFLRCGSTNTEPGAVATGFDLRYRLRKNRDSAIALFMR